MKFIPVTGTPPVSKPFRYTSDNLQQQDMTDPGRLMQVIRGLMARVAELETDAGPEGVEFEINFRSTGTQVHFLAHGFNCPVRYFPVCWKPVSTDALSMPRYDEALTTSNVLAIRNPATLNGRVVIRIEPSQHALTKGT